MCILFLSDILRLSLNPSISPFYIVKVRAFDDGDSLCATFYISLCDILLQMQYKVLEYAYCII